MNSLAEGVRAPSWRAFTGGLLRPSGLALAVALVVPVLGFGAASFLITPQRLAHAPNYFAKASDDTDLFASATIAKCHLNPGETAVYLFGASSIMSALTSSDEFRAQLVENSPLDIKVCDLRTDGQNVGQTVALAETLPSELAGIAVIEVNPRSLAGKVSVPPFRVARMSNADPLPGEFFWTNRRFFLPRLLPSIGRVLAEEPVEQAEPAWLSKTEPIEEAAGLELEQWLGETVNRRYRHQALRTLGEYSRIVSDLRKRGLWQIVFLEAPSRERTRSVVIGEPIWSQHVERMKSFAEERGVLYWDLCEEAELEDTDFFDYTHLYRRPARERFTSALAGRVAALLVELQI